MSRSVGMDYDTLRSRERTPGHTQCADCGKCRVVQSEKWCWNCLHWSCERGGDCCDLPG